MRLEAVKRIAVKNKACFSSIDDLFDTVQGGRYFTKLDLRARYHQILIQDEDVPRTAINTPLGHFQFRVMAFGLTNSPATFQTLMNSILHPYLRKFVVVFLDDILIFSKSWDEHLQYVRTVLEALRNTQLYCKSSKCEFGLQEVLFLGYHVNGHSILPDPTKIDAVRAWPPPSSVKDVRQFLGFTSKDLSITTPIYRQPRSNLLESMPDWSGQLFIRRLLNPFVRPCSVPLS